MKKDEAYNKKFMAFAIRMVKLKNYLNEQRHEYNMADQVQRSGTAIGANHREATYSESSSDFVHKLQIAQKECNETMYWLKVLYGSELISQERYEELLADVRELYKILAASLKTLKS